mmetsp:Transcript_38465/g.86730  ORF Transcript_38465/g.86730 Transcript_38465/m.86730 type:complete len:225 (+) Transcript_38465:525-1199(+)
MRDHALHYLRPGLEEGLVPDGCPKAGDVHPRSCVQQVPLVVPEHFVASGFVHQVELVDEAEDAGARRKLAQGVHGMGEVVQVLRHLGSGVLRHVGASALVAHRHQHVDEDLRVLKDGLPLRLEVVLHEDVLPATVPEVQTQVAKEPERVVLNEVGLVQPVGVAGEVVREDDRLHGGLPSAGAAHQQDLRALGSLRHGWRGSGARPCPGRPLRGRPLPPSCPGTA